MIPPARIPFRRPIRECPPMPLLRPTRRTLLTGGFIGGFLGVLPGRPPGPDRPRGSPPPSPRRRAASSAWAAPSRRSSTASACRTRWSAWTPRACFRPRPWRRSRTWATCARSGRRACCRSSRPSSSLSDGAGPPDVLRILEGAGLPLVRVPDDPSPAGISAKIAAVAGRPGRCIAGRRPHPRGRGGIRAPRGGAQQP